MLQRQGNQVYWHITECLAVALAGSRPRWDGAASGFRPGPETGFRFGLRQETNIVFMQG